MLKTCISLSNDAAGKRRVFCEFRAAKLQLPFALNHQFDGGHKGSNEASTRTGNREILIFSCVDFECLSVAHVNVAYHSIAAR